MPPEIKPPTTEEIEQALKEGGIPSIEINNALKEFEVQSKEYNIPQKKEEKIDAPKVILFTMKYSGGLIKEPKQAEYFLSFMAFLLILISVFFTFNSFKGPSLPPIPPTPFEEGNLIQ